MRLFFSKSELQFRVRNHGKIEVVFLMKNINRGVFIEEIPDYDHY